MLGGYGTPDNYNAERASSLCVREPSKKKADVRTGRVGGVRLQERSISHRFETSVKVI
jgi:hypothetical protein